MKIEKNKWVSIHYVLKDDKGLELYSSYGKEPLGYIYGNGYLIVGLENELEGKEEGEKFSCDIPAKDAYGEYDPALISDVPVENFEISTPIEVGMNFQAMTPQGPRIVRVVEVSDKTIKIDGNHELAGKTLHFDIEIVEVRDATEEELNPRGCGGCGGNCGGCGGGCGSSCDCSGCNS